ncbi:MAG: class I SAM-dependent methyltransferase [Bacteroidales bacterium]|nr:class I SAM-dependent methyltransferase [Bacteroidales bacterium]
MAKRIIEGVSEHVILPIEGRGLDVGCGSGALAIAVAKLNPQAEVVGVDRWGMDYASYSKTLCEQNAQAEGVVNVVFAEGDALQLDFEDESFDAVFSNYVYHNIRSKNRQDILLETLRVLKKGGLFVIHDIFSWANYGDMQQFLRQLKEMGYERAELINTTEGIFMSKWEASWMMLDGSAILVGKK